MNFQKNRIPFTDVQEEKIDSFLSLGDTFSIIGLEASAYNNKIERYLEAKELPFILINCRLLSREHTLYDLLDFTLRDFQLITKKHSKKSILGLLRLVQMKTILLIENVESLIEMESDSIYLLSLITRTFSSKIQIIYTGNQKVLHDTNAPILGMDSLLRNLIINKLFTKKEFAYAFVDSAKINTLSKDVLEHLYYLIGGYSSLSWCISFIYKEKGEKGIAQSELEKDVSVNARLDRFYYSLSEKEKSYLINLSVNPHYFDKSLFPYFIEMGLLDANGVICSSLVKHYLLTKVTQKSFDKNDARLKFQKALSIQEEKIFNLLLRTQGAIVDRDTVSKILWEENEDEKYSDCAITQVIKRLRKKLLSAAKDLHLQIVTHKGKGYSLEVLVESTRMK